MVSTHKDIFIHPYENIKKVPTLFNVASCPQRQSSTPNPPHPRLLIFQSSYLPLIYDATHLLIMHIIMILC